MKTLSLKAKMMLVSGLLLAIISTSSIVFFKELYSSNMRARQADRALALLDEVEVAFNMMTIGMRGYMLDSSRKEEWNSKLKADEEASGKIEKLAELKQFPELVELAQKIREFDEKTMNRLENEFGELVEQKRTEAATEFYFKKYMPARTKMDGVLKEAIESAQKERDASESYADRILITGGTVLFGITLLSLVFSFIFNQRIAGRVTTSIQALTEKLNASVMSIELASKNTASASQQIATSATENASAITETLSISEAGKKESEHGKNVVGRMADAMVQVADSNSRLETLIKVIEDIQSKTKVINDIVFETRLLSFNASIEAARAGVHGKGFAVVAEEVGKLAAVSGKAAEEINALLANSTHHVRDIVSTTGQRVSVAKDASQQCEQVFEQMSHAMSEINRAMADMERETHHNSASSEEMANQAQTLSLEARSLTGLLGRLRAVVSGNAQGEQADGHEPSTSFTQESEQAFSGIHSTGKTAKLQVVPDSTYGVTGSSIFKRSDEAESTDAGTDGTVDRSDVRWKTSA